MIEIGAGAIFQLVKCVYGAAVVIQIRIRASEVAMRVDGAGEPIHTTMIVLRAGAAMVWTHGVVRQRTEVVVERMVLLHHDNYVVDLVKVAIRAGCRD